MRPSRGSASALVALFAALLAVLAPAAHAETVYALEDLGLRGEPDRSASVLQTVPRGTPLVMVGGRHNNWIRVAAPGTGYALYVEISKLGAAPPPESAASAPAAERAPAAPGPAPTPRPVPAATPKPAPTRPAAVVKKDAAPAAAPKGKGGHGKLLAIGGGVLAAGGGAAIAASSSSGGGGGAPSTMPPAPAGPASAVVFVSSDVPKRFDPSTSASALMVGGLEGTIADARVSVNLSTNCGRDLALQLVHPDGTVVVLMFQGVPGCSPTRLAATFPTERAPYEPLTKLFGKAAAGAWQLRASGSGGELGGWSLALTAHR